MNLEKPKNAVTLREFQGRTQCLETISTGIGQFFKEMMKKYPRTWQESVAAQSVGVGILLIDPLIDIINGREPLTKNFCRGIHTLQVLLEQFYNDLVARFDDTVVSEARTLLEEMKDSKDVLDMEKKPL